MRITREEQLWAPINDMLREQGYRIRSEVENCDIVAMKDGRLIAVELKLRFNMSLLLQGVERQRVVDYVYLAIEKPKRWSRKRSSQIRRLCQRLDLGLMLVSFSSAGEPYIHVSCEPDVLHKGRSSAGRERLLKEFYARSADYNIGGSTRRPIVTAYREDALRLAFTLHQQDEMSVRALREATGIQKAGPILQRNYYGWFERVQRGVYTLSIHGEKALQQYADIIRGWRDYETSVTTTQESPADPRPHKPQ